MRPLRHSDPSTIAGYRLLGRLGAGGMGVVYLGRSSGGTLVALKVIHPEQAEDPGFRVRFRREVAAARLVQSPWAVPVVDADPDARAPWLASAYVPGPALSEAVVRTGPLPLPTLRRLGQLLAEALESVHAAGLVHRDVKPGNVLLALDGPRLIDFGIARALDDTALTATNMVIGSPGYLSPEQARAGGAEVGPPSDVFSLGCVLAYAATGRAPFGSGDAPALLYRTVHDAPDIDGVPEELFPLVERCLEKNVRRRPSAAALRRELAVGAAGPAGDDWLPGPVTHLVAWRSAQSLDLPDVEATVADADGTARAAGVTAAASGASAGDGGAAGGGRPRRRRLLAVAGGAALAVGAGVGGWAVLRDSDDSDGGAGGAGGADGAGGDRARAGNGLPIFRIGLHAALTGPYAARGEAQRTGALLAVEQFNARRGRPFEAALRSADDGGRPQRSAAAARSLVADPSVLAVVGPSTDATADPAGPIYEAPSLAWLAVSFSKFVVPGDSIDGTLLYARPASGGELGPFPIYLRKETKAKTAAVIYDRHLDDYGRWATKAAVKLLPLADFTPVPRVLPMLVGDYRPLVRELLDRKVGAVVYMGGPHGAAEVAKELDRNGFSGPRVAGEPALDPQFLTEAGDAANGWMVNASFIDATVKPEAASFAAAYRKRFGKQPPYHAAEAYDVAQLILRTLTELATGAAAGTAPSGSPSRSGGTGSGPAGGASSAGSGAPSAGAGRVRTPQRKQVLDRLRTARYRGVAKEIAFSKEYGQYEPNEGSFLYRVERGRFRYVGNAWDV